MKIFVLLLCAALVGFGMYKGQHSHHLSGKKQKTETVAIQDEKPFVIIVPSYNNSAFVEKNLRSIFTQSYKNYRVLYIDDHSADDTYLKAKKLITELQQTQRTTLVRNEQNQGALANLYNAIHSCQDHEIVVLVDGDDFLAHEHVLSILNQTYQDNSVWMTYGNFLDYPTYQQNPVRCKELPDGVIRRGSFRKHEWVTTHLRTFYASLFKKIDLHDMVHRGRFFPMGWDLAFMMPLLEMSGPHVRFIKDTLYLYNRNNPISDHRVNFQFQQECADAVRKKQPYKRLQELTTSHVKNQKKVECVIFSSGNPLQLYALLESLTQYDEDAGKVSVLCPRSKQLQSNYEEIEKEFSKIHFIYTNEFKTVFLKLLEDTTLDNSAYVLLAQDNLILKEAVHLSEAADLLEKTRAFGLYFSLGSHIQLAEDMKTYQELPPLLPLRTFSLKEPLMGWQLAAGSGDWKKAHPFDLVLYSKKQLKELVASAHFNSPASLEAVLEKKRASDALGLFYAQSKCVKTSLSTEMLNLFEQGLKIDVNAFYQVQNRSKQSELKPVLIKK
ncbi:MAG TPA: glycosyltransferase family A protein [Rhabdochlamydiaceae bacterium]|nr:glycosyltransferase family A protein [Rhabdochlamydiaceae bacterium]